MALATRTINGNNSGPLTSQPKVVVIHATRSGIATKTDAEELLSTLNWFVNPDGASSHWVLSEIERVRVVADDLLAWHVGYLNGKSRGVELTQPTIDRPFTDGHYENAALIGRHYVSLGVVPVWLPYWDGNTVESGFVAHEDTIQGRQSGKSDPGPQFDRQRFITSLSEEEDMAAATPEDVRETARALSRYLRTGSAGSGLKGPGPDDPNWPNPVDDGVNITMQAILDAIVASPGSGGALSDADVDRIADAVVIKMAAWFAR